MEIRTRARCEACGALMCKPGKLCRRQRVCCGHCADGYGHGASCVALNNCSSCGKQFVGRGKTGSHGELFCCGHCSSGRGHGWNCRIIFAEIYGREETPVARDRVAQRSRSPRRRPSAESIPRCSICLSNNPTFECMPCHHCCICSSCRNDFHCAQCPICRCVITSVDEVYFS